MDKLRFMKLLDLYGALLTPTQREIADMFFNLDLTVSEIAEEKGISRQGVSDCINICKRELEAYEQKLGREGLLSAGGREDKIRLWAQDFLALHPEYAGDIAALMQILKG